MITQENARNVFNTLKVDEVAKALESKGDYLKIELFIFNAGHQINIEGTEYNEEDETEINNNGNLYIDKDQFIQLLSDFTIEKFDHLY